MKHKANKTITIKEYWFLSSCEDAQYESGVSAYIDPTTFDEIKKFLLDEKNQAYEVLTLARRRWYGEIIKAQNYVWVIQTSNGTSIEILPKISDSIDIDNTRSIFLKMLKSLKNSPFKNIEKASLKRQKFPILEIFISLFLHELDLLVKKGIKRNYVVQERNVWFLKGKFKAGNNIKHNLTHKERFYCEFDEFTDNIKENKLIKTCLQHLAKVSRKEENKQKIKEFLFIFAEIDASKNIKYDSASLNNLNRLSNYYADTLQRVKIFLLGESVVNFAWSTLALSLLFPMEKIFENYVAKKLKHCYPHRDIRTQDTTHYLVEYHNERRKFNMRPDIVIANKAIIADTKWKVIDQEDAQSNYNVSQADMYQLFAYAKKYNAKSVYLIYPKTDKFTKPLNPFHYEKDDTILHVIPYDLVTDHCEEFI